ENFRSYPYYGPCSSKPGFLTSLRGRVAASRFRLPIRVHRFSTLGLNTSIRFLQLRKIQKEGGDKHEIRKASNRMLAKCRDQCVGEPAYEAGRRPRRSA